MFYKFDKNLLLWKRDWRKGRVAISLVIVFVIISFILGRFVKFTTLDKYERQLLIINLHSEKNKFTKEKFVSELKRLNVKFPYIVMAQAIVETGDFQSAIFKENNNLFGMKQAPFRINTAKGTQNGHAYYENWAESIYDYAFYQCRYLSDINTEEEYFLYLGRNYAEDPLYVAKVKDMVKKQNLEKLFK